MKGTAAFLVAAVLSVAVCQQYGDHALFIRTSPYANSRARRAAPASPADVMAQNILEWIQGIYRQGIRKIRQQSEPPGYLPPYSNQRPPEKPRPFQAPSTPNYYSPSPSQNEVPGYSYQRPSTVISSPGLSFVPGEPSTVQTPPPFTAGKPTYLPPKSQSPYGSSSTSYNPRPTTSPSYTNDGSSAYPPFSSTRGSMSYIPPESPRLSSTVAPSVYSSPAASTGYSYSSPSYGSSSRAPFSTPSGFSSTYSAPSTTPTSYALPEEDSPSGTSGGYPSNKPSSTLGYPSETPSKPFESTESGYSYAPPPSTTSENTLEINVAGESGDNVGVGGISAEDSGSSSTTTDDGHPPHIHAINVECSKTMMTISIEFNRAYDGIIYSKGYFMNPECKYVEQNSGLTNYSFTVNQDSCGTQFINDFAGEAGQSYLENVLVLQNEPGIQEVWDTVQRVRCLWEGNIKEALKVNLSVDMLKQEIVTFSGDTAVAKLDIQVGKGPFAPAADGLVKIGETMTLVVSVQGDPGFDLQVRDCVARDESSNNMIQLTDERGCILKPKLFGAFQKTNDTGSSEASVIAYAFFQAFKFPDVMDLFIECNVELCKVDCEPCPEPDQKIEPGRRRRSILYSPPSKNTSTELLSDPIRVVRGFKVILMDDLSEASSQALQHLEETAVTGLARTSRNVCMTYSGFYAAVSLILSTVAATTVSTVVFYVKWRLVNRSKFTHS